MEIKPKSTVANDTNKGMQYYVITNVTNSADDNKQLLLNTPTLVTSFISFLLLHL